jgi:cell division septal protein FtsQ
VRPFDVKAIKYRDNLASKRRRSFHIKSGLIALVVVTVLVFLGYALFYAPWLKVNNLTFKGLDSQHQDEVQGVVDDALNYKFLGLPTGRDILFVHAGALSAELASQFSFLGDVSIQKNYPHTLQINATERSAEGVWCFQADCRYFDHNGITFGQAIQSSGVLLLNVDDLRTISASASLTSVDFQFLKAIQTVVPTLTSQGVKVKNITIPTGSYVEFDVLVSDLTGSYPVKFSLDSNIQKQLDVYRIFRTQKMADGRLHPQYIDLRFDGRVYFK